MTMYLNPSPRSAVVYHNMPVNDFVAGRDLFRDDPLITKLRSILPDGAVIAGGYLSALVFRAMHSTGYPSKDIDVFFTDDMAAYRASEVLRLAGYEKDSSAEVPPSCENFRPIQDQNSDGVPGPVTVQLVKKELFADAEAVIDSFDFTACQLAISVMGLFIGPQTLADIAGKRLRFHRLKTDQNRNRERVLKYASKGYTVLPQTLELLGKSVGGPERCISEEEQANASLS